MKGIIKLFKVVAEISIILLLLTIFVVTINFLQGNRHDKVITTGAEIYPPPPNINKTHTPTYPLNSPYPAPNEQSTIPASTLKKKYIGPDCLIDRSKSISIQLPTGWYGDLSANSINISNYDPDSIEYEHGKPKNMPPNGIKIEIYALKLEPEQTIEQWILAEKNHSLKQGNNSLTISENVPYQLGKYNGVTYEISDTLGWNSKVFVLEVEIDRGIVLNIFPADSQAFTDALVILSAINASDNLTCDNTSYSLNQSAKLSNKL